MKIYLDEMLKDVPRPDELRTMLLLVSVDAPIDVLERLTAKERYDAGNWAVAVHLKASDNDDIIVPERPRWTLDWEANVLDWLNEVV